MSHHADVEYYRHRTVQERQRAAVAQENTTRRVHLDLATRYAQRADEVEHELAFNPRGSGSA